MPDTPHANPTMPAIMPGEGGKSFVWYGDCCSGIPGGSNEANFSAVNAVFQRLSAMPDVTFFIGDSIVGYTDDADALRSQWRYWIDHEMAWFHTLGIPLYTVPSNHNTTNAIGEDVFREIHGNIPQNGPDDQRGLAYWVRDGEFLYVFVNTSFSGLGGDGHVEHAWLDQVLTEHADARVKLVIGHHPIHAVNGYDLYPQWRVTPEEGRAFWDTLARHDVTAYLCSHILLFDVQVHDGVLQIATGGAGTYGMPTVGLMPESSEYFHLVQAVIDDLGVRYQVLDTDGISREWLQWPEPALENADIEPFSVENAPTAPPDTSWIARFRIAGTARRSDNDQTIIAGWQTWEGPEAIWIGLTANNRLTIQLVPEPGRGAQRWLGPELAETFDIEIAIHSGMGPGGVLWRHPGGAWSSLRSTSARGAERLAWPERWSLLHGQSGTSDRAFAGSIQDMRARFDRQPALPHRDSQ